MHGFNAFSSNLRVVVGNGARIRFWEDCWLDSQPLCLKFPRLYKLTSSQNVLVLGRVDCSSIHKGWHFDFRRNLNDREIKEFSSFISMLEGVSFNPSSDDCRTWRLSYNDIFSCKSFFEKLVQDDSIPRFEYDNFIWKSKALNKIKFLLWLIARGKVSTCDIIQKRFPSICLSPLRCVAQELGEKLGSSFFFIVPWLVCYRICCFL